MKRQTRHKVTCEKCGALLVECRRRTQIKPLADGKIILVLFGIVHVECAKCGTKRWASLS